jgi:DNA-binding XRE family transcriptional regulator
MKLDRYLWENKISQRDFGKEIGLSSRPLWLIVHNISTPCLVTAIKIVKATKGEVSYEDLLNDKDREKLKND